LNARRFVFLFSFFFPTQFFPTRFFQHLKRGLLPWARRIFPFFPPSFFPSGASLFFLFTPAGGCPSRQSSQDLFVSCFLMLSGLFEVLRLLPLSFFIGVFLHTRGITFFPRSLPPPLFPPWLFLFAPPLIHRISP